MLASILALALGTSTIFNTGLLNGQPGSTFLSPNGTTPAALVDTLPFTPGNLLFAEDANTVAHVYWNGSALVDTRGNAWARTGTPASNWGQGLFFNGPTVSSLRYGGGAFTTTGFWATSSPQPDALDFSSYFTVCVAGVTGDNGSVGNDIVVSDRWTSGNHAGWLIAFIGGTFSITTGNGAAGGTVTTGTGLSTNSRVFIGCAGRNSSGVSAQLDNGTPAGPLNYAYAPDTGTNAEIGIAPNSTYAFNGTIYEVYATSTPWDNANVARLIAGAYGQTDSSGNILAVTRTGAAQPLTFVQQQGSYTTYGANVLRLVPRADGTVGALIEPSSTNYVLNARVNPKTAEATASLPVGNYVAWAASQANAAANFTVTAGTAVVSSLACTNEPASGVCTFAVTTAGTMTVTTANMTLGDYFQIEPGSYPTSFINTAGTAATRQADVMSIASPLTTNPAAWCVDATVAPEGAVKLGTVNAGYTIGPAARGWDAPGSPAPWSAGTDSTANAWRVYDDGAGNLVWEASQKTATAAHGFAAGTAHRLSTGSNSAGTLSFLADGVSLAATPGGAGTGIVNPQPATLRIGSSSTSGTQAGAVLTNLRFFSDLCSKVRAP